MSDQESTIRVAIIGGGIAGAALLRGLLQYSHISADFYEVRPTFREESIGIDLSITTQNILRAIDPALGGAPEQAGAINNSTEFRLATGPLAGQRLPINSVPQKKTVGRQAFLSVLLAGVPPHMLHANTRVLSVSEASEEDGVLLTLADGTQRHYDVVIGGDGLHGATRAYVLGPNDPALKPKPSGFWGLTVKIPLERAQRVMGHEILDPSRPRQVGWIGNGTYMQHDLINNGNDVHIVIYAKNDNLDEEFAWAKIFTPDEFEDMFSQNQGLACQGMMKLIQSVYTIHIAGICQMQHVPIRTYAAKNACLIGDAAHTLLPHQIHTANIVIEEAFILSALLGRATNPDHIPAALRAFDYACRPRAERVIQWSSNASLLTTGRAPNVGLNADLVADNLTRQWEYIQNLDISVYKRAAVEAMEEFMGSEKVWRS